MPIRERLLLHFRFRKRAQLRRETGAAHGPCTSNCITSRRAPTSRLLSLFLRLYALKQMPSLVAAPVRVLVAYPAIVLRTRLTL